MLFLADCDKDDNAPGVTGENETATAFATENSLETDLPEATSNHKSDCIPTVS